MDNTNPTETYRLNSSANPVTLKVTVGYGQTGAIGVSLNGNPVVKPGADTNNQYTDECEFVIGTNSELNNGVLVIPVSVTRVQDTVQQTSIKISLTGGVTPSNYPPFTAIAANKGDVVPYLALITFGN